MSKARKQAKPGGETQRVLELERLVRRLLDMVEASPFQPREWRYEKNAAVAILGGATAEETYR